MSVFRLDVTLKEEDIQEAITKAIGLKDETEIRVERIKMNPNGHLSTIVRLSKANADELASLRKLRVGWSRCVLKQWLNVPVCYKCQEVGHKAGNCTQKTALEKRCYKCGEIGHIGRNCKTTEIKCHYCQVDGHSAYSTSCPRYKKMITELRDKAIPNEKEKEELQDQREPQETETSKHQNSDGANQDDQVWTTIQGKKKTLTNNPK